MSAAHTAAGRASGKRQGSPTSVDEYLAGIPEPARSTLGKVRAAIRSALPREATECLSYGIPACKYKVALVWYAAFSKHCSFFPTAAVIEAFKKDLKSYAVSKGTIQFAIDKPLPAVLVKKMVKARLAQVKRKKRGGSLVEELCSSL